MNWTNLENISVPISAVKMKAIATVLTQKGAGTVLCPQKKCNILNIVRDGIFRCYCGFKSNIMNCVCGCGEQLLDRDRWGNSRQYIYGHNWCGKNNLNWRGGRRLGNHGYWVILRHDHHEADRDGYVLEHRLVYEEYHKCCLLSWSRIHHDDGDKENNEISNLIITSRWEHKNKFHREDFGQVCERCGSTDVCRNSFTKMGKQRFRCNNCRKNWSVNKTGSIDFGQICQNCGSRHIIKNGGVF